MEDFLWTFLILTEAENLRLMKEWQRLKYCVRVQRSMKHFFGDAGDFATSDSDDELEDDLTIAGLDIHELEFMDEDERREAIEDAGLDPDDYDMF